MRVVIVCGRWQRAGRYEQWAGLGPDIRHVELAAALAGTGHEPVVLRDGDVDDAPGIVRLVQRSRPDGILIDLETLPEGAVAALVAAGYRTVRTSASSRAPGALHRGETAAVIGALEEGPRRAAGGEPLAEAPPLPVAPGEVGLVEVAWEGAHGVVHRHSTHRVVEAVKLCRARRDQVRDQIIELVGLDLVSAADCLDELVAAGMPPGNLSASLRAGGVVGPGLGLLDRAVVVVHDATDVAALAEALAVLERGEVDTVIEIIAGEDLDELETVVDLACRRGVELRYRWAPGVSAEAVDMAEALAGRAGSPTPADQDHLGPCAALVGLISGRFEGEPPSGALRAVWVDEEAAATGPVVLGATGYRSDIFSATGASAGDGRHWATGGDLRADGDLRLPTLGCEVSGYRLGRHATPLQPLALVFQSRADLDAFLSDADVAHHRGAFPRALLSPFTLMADAHAWRAADPAGADALTRASVDGAGVRLGMNGPVLGQAGDDFPQLQRALRQQRFDAVENRGCVTCPVAATCSRSLVVSRLMTDEDYCAAHLERPWLAGYLDAIDVLRRVVADPAGPRPRVAGMGGALVAPDQPDFERRWPDRPPLILAEWDGSFFGAQPGGAPFRLTPDTALIAELLTGMATTKMVPEAVARHFGLEQRAAQQAVSRVIALLRPRGIDLGRARSADLPADHELVPNRSNRPERKEVRP